MKLDTTPAKPTCIHCGTSITAITHRLNDGFCMVCCDPFPAIKGTKHLLNVMSARRTTLNRPANIGV